MSPNPEGGRGINICKKRYQRHNKHTITPKSVLKHFVCVCVWGGGGGVSYNSFKGIMNIGA